MRLGVLPFGADTWGMQIAAEMRERDVDVVVADEAATLGVIAAREAERLQRADCDAVALFIGEGTKPIWALQAALHLGSPMVVLGPMSPFFQDAHAALAEIGVPHHHLVIAGGVTNLLYDWLNENKKSARQPGIEAARKLYGQTFAYSGDSFPDAAQWIRQFGVVPVPQKSEDAVNAAFAAPDGDAAFALTLHLLRLISGQEPTAFPAGTLFADSDVTAARITKQEHRFVCHALHGSDNESRMKEDSFNGLLAVAPGNHVAALRAACESLNIECVS